MEDGTFNVPKEEEACFFNLCSWIEMVLELGYLADVIEDLIMYWSSLPIDKIGTKSFFVGMFIRTLIDNQRNKFYNHTVILKEFESVMKIVTEYFCNNHLPYDERKMEIVLPAIFEQLKQKPIENCDPEEEKEYNIISFDVSSVSDYTEIVGEWRRELISMPTSSEGISVNVIYCFIRCMVSDIWRKIQNDCLGSEEFQQVKILMEDYVSEKHLPYDERNLQNILPALAKYLKQNPVECK